MLLEPKKSYDMPFVELLNPPDLALCGRKQRYNQSDLELSKAVSTYLRGPDARICLPCASIMHYCFLNEII